MVGAMAEFVFSLTLSFLLTHELDAMRGREWRILPGFRSLSDQSGRDLFIILHLPLFAALLLFCWSSDQGTQEVARSVVALFGIVHLGLHWLFRNRPGYDFGSALSRSLIWGYALTGIAYLTITQAV